MVEFPFYKKGIACKEDIMEREHICSINVHHTFHLVNFEDEKTQTFQVI